MRSKKRKKEIRKFAFTLIELVIVLVIIGILLMATLYLSGEQIQKVRNKAVKESILSEMQSRYSRNLGSSSFAGKMYKTMDVTFLEGTRHIDFKYNLIDDEKNSVENTFTDKFEIKYITTNYKDPDTPNPGKNKVKSIDLIYTPYQISCQIGEESENNDNVVMMIRVNDNRDYCFEIQKKNCRLMEMAEFKCNTLKEKAHINN